MRYLTCVFIACLYAAMLIGSGPGLLEQGAAACNHGDYAAAAELFAKAVAEQPESLLARQHLAHARVRRVLAERGPNRAALAREADKALDAVLARDPGDPAAWSNRIRLELALGNLEAAERAAAKLTGAHPHLRDGWYMRALIRWTEAWTGLELARKNAVARAALLARAAEGHGFLGRALAIEPEFTWAMLYDSLLYRLEGQLREGADAAVLIARADARLREAAAVQAQGAPSGVRPPQVQADAPPPPVEAPPPPPPPPGNK